MDRETLEAIQQNPELLIQHMSRVRLQNFVRYMEPKYSLTPFHRAYMEAIDRFAHGKIKKLIISAPPQHGKSQLSSRMLPAFLLGINPDLKIVIGSYNTDQARSFNRDVQRIINSDAYKAVFPDTFLNDGKMRMDNVYACNADTSEPVGHRGSLRAVGRSGSLTGKSVDIMILDDLYKDFAEANSALVRNLAWKWYTTVVRTRYHNHSQELIVFTRWHEDDIIGRMEQSGEKIIKLKNWSDLDNVPEGAWLQLNFQALKVGDVTEVDPREVGEPLWPEKHSKEQLLAAKSLDPVQFECLYQGDPGSAEGRLYGDFKTYGDKSEYGTFIRKGGYIDVADKGDDFLCSLSYDIYKSPNTFFNEQTKRFEPILYALITDVIYTQEGTEVTTMSVPQQINTMGSQVVWVESNNGGGQFANTIAKKVKAQVKSFFTSGNKESRIISNSSQVMSSIVFPIGWETKWPAFHNALTHFLRTFSANAHDDAADAVTGICEKEINSGNCKGYSSARRGLRRGN